MPETLVHLLANGNLVVSDLAMAISIRNMCFVKASMPSLMGFSWRSSLESSSCEVPLSLFLTNLEGRPWRRFGSSEIVSAAGSLAASWDRGALSLINGVVDEVGERQGGVNAAASRRETLSSTDRRLRLRKAMLSLSPVTILRMAPSAASDILILHGGQCPV